jgi:hypothetical protein
VYFGINDDKYFDENLGGPLVSRTLIPTIFRQGEIIRYDYAKYGSWDGDNPNADFYEEFFLGKELILPRGTYEIYAKIQCEIESGPQYEQIVSTIIKVE